MSGRTIIAGPIAVALVVSTAWLYAGCGGDVTADDLGPHDGMASPLRDEAGEPARAGASGREPSFFDRLLGERTRKVTVPAGTVLELRFSETVSSRRNAAGDAFRTTVEEDVRVDDAIAVPAGSEVIGRVTEAEQPRNVGGRARLSLDFHALEVPSGETVAIESVFTSRGRSQNLKDAAIIAGSTLGGVVLGEAVDEGEGGVIGGILGGIGGAVAASRNQAKPVEVPAGAILAVELVRPVTLEVPA